MIIPALNQLEFECKYITKPFFVDPTEISHAETSSMAVETKEKYTIATKEKHNIVTKEKISLTR